MNAEHLGRAVVVGVDGSGEALRAVRWAVPEARRRQAVLRLVGALVRTDGWPGLGHEAGEHLRAAAQNALACAAAAVSELDSGLPVERELAIGFAGAVLVEQSWDAGLLVVGGRGRGRIGFALAGSVAVGVAARSVCPVVVVRGAESSPDQRLPVVVGIDGTPLSEAAIGFAFEAASVRRAPLVAVHTWVDELNEPPLAALVNWPSAAAAAEEILAERLAGWGEKYPDVFVQRVLAPGRAARALLDQAASAQLVVVGSRGHGKTAGLLLDSVSNALVHSAGCPVAVVRTRK